MADDLSLSYCTGKWYFIIYTFYDLFIHSLIDVPLGCLANPCPVCPSDDVLCVG